MKKSKATGLMSTFLEIGIGKISAQLELDHRMDFTGRVLLNTENDRDRTFLLNKIFPLLRGKKVTFVYARRDK
jgi:hypothetical protein